MPRESAAPAPSGRSEPGASSDGDHVEDVADFAPRLREAIRLSGMSLRRVQERLRDRGYVISVSTLSMWQTAARRPTKDTSFDAIRELERLLHLEDGELVRVFGTARLVRPFPGDGIQAIDPMSELIECSGAVGVYVDIESRITRTVNRTVWQACVDGACDATLLLASNETGTSPSEVDGTIGCDVTDVVRRRTQTRASIRLHSPLRRGELTLTECQTVVPPHAGRDRDVTVVAPYRQAETMLHVVFDPRRRPRHCRVIVESENDSRAHRVPLNGDCATHAEFDFGPGQLTLAWEW